MVRDVEGRRATLSKESEHQYGTYPVTGTMHEMSRNFRDIFREAMQLDAEACEMRKLSEDDPIRMAWEIRDLKRRNEYLHRQLQQCREIFEAIYDDYDPDWMKDLKSFMGYN